MTEGEDIVYRNPDRLEAWRDLVRDFEQRGMALRTYDAAVSALEQNPGDKWLQHRAVLALARSGATETAAARFAEYGLGNDDDEDTASLGARLAKDLVWLVSGDDQIQRARVAAEAYGRVFERTGGYYPAVNLATLRLISGACDEARDIARRLLNELEPSPQANGIEAYYHAATVAEACLILGDVGRARAALRQAMRAYSDDLGARATTRKQLRRICRVLDLDDTLLEELATGHVIHFTGHLIAKPGAPGRFLAESEKQAEAEIAKHLDAIDAAFGYGSIACGADTLFAEALLARGAELNLVLPFKFDEFLDTSVRGGGAGWEERARRCLDAATVTFATEDSYLGDDALFGYASRLSMGLALLRGDYLDAPVEQVALWDGKPAQGPVGTAVDVEIWRGVGFPQTIIPCRGRQTAPTPPAASMPVVGRVNRAMLFGDIKGFSKLDDRQLPIFVQDVLGAMAAVLERYTDSLRFRNTWGDGIYLVFDDLVQAAHCALDLQAAITELPLNELGLPDHISLRLGGHYGPVYESADPIVGNSNFFGAHVSRAARIEPITPEGSVYVTEHFAAALEVDAHQTFSCNYVGTVPAAKGYGSLAMYLLRSRSAALTMSDEGASDPKSDRS